MGTRRGQGLGKGLVGHFEDAGLALFRQGKRVVDEGVVAGLERCELDEAALGGADAIKFQTYKAGTCLQAFPGLLGHHQRADPKPVRTVQKARLVLEKTNLKI